MNILFLFWIARVNNGQIEWELVDRENLQLSIVYILKCDLTGKVKIGITQHFDRRIKEVQSMCPTKLRCVVRFATMGQGLESFLHSHFEQYRLHGEWFLIPPGKDGPIVELTNKAVELQSKSPFENETIFKQELMYQDCPF